MYTYMYMCVYIYCVCVCLCVFVCRGGGISSDCLLYCCVTAVLLQLLYLGWIGRGVCSGCLM